MKKRLRKMLLALLISLGLLALGIGFYLQHPKFGTLPEGATLERIKSSPNYLDGQFQNLIPTPMNVGGNSAASSWVEFLFAKKERPVPASSIPSIKTDLINLDKNRDVVVWLGHSSCFIQLGGKRILIDPVFSSYAAPVSFANKAFEGTNPYKAEDIPEIDYLFISHDHWDHLDYSTVMALKPKIKNVVCSLGVGTYFEQWGFPKEIIHEEDWFTALKLENDFIVHILPARHYSSRLLDRNKTLWAGFALITPERRIFYSGDSGYGPHFKEIGDRLGGFDLVILDNGQYDKKWPYIHMTPEEAVQAAGDLKAQALLPAHVGKFTIANHPWDEPFERMASASRNKEYRLFTPIIGEPIELENHKQLFRQWWKTVK